MAASSHTLVRGPITSRDWFSLRLGVGGRGGERERHNYSEKHKRRLGGREEWNLLRALSISMVTSTERAMVMG